MAKSYSNHAAQASPATLSLSVPEHVLERLIASGALCAADVNCLHPGDKRRIMAICKRCCAHRLASGH